MGIMDTPANMHSDFTSEWDRQIIIFSFGSTSVHSLYVQSHVSLLTSPPFLSRKGKVMNERGMARAGRDRQKESI